MAILAKCSAQAGGSLIVSGYRYARSQTYAVLKGDVESPLAVCKAECPPTSDLDHSSADRLDTDLSAAAVVSHLLVAARESAKSC